MKTYLNEREIQQGEDWNVDLLLSQGAEEYVPFIVGLRENPMFVMTVASTKFEKNQRYVESWWNAYDGPMFVNTNPLRAPNNGILVAIPDTPSDVVTAWNLTPGFFNVTDESCHLQNLYEYKLANDTEWRYLYVKRVEGRIDTFELVHGYECRLRFNIISSYNTEGTAKWTGQNYMYQITLVSGELMENVICSIKQSHPNLEWRDDWPTSNVENWLNDNANIKKDVFNFIKKRLPDFFQPDIDWNSPLGRIWVPQVILPPTKIQVNNNLRVII